MAWIEFEGSFINLDNTIRLSPVKENSYLGKNDFYFMLYSIGDVNDVWSFKNKKQAEEKRAELIHLIKKSERKSR